MLRRFCSPITGRPRGVKRPLTELGGPFAQLRITGATSRDVGHALAESLLSGRMYEATDRCSRRELFLVSLREMEIRVYPSYPWSRLGEGEIIRAYPHNPWLKILTLINHYNPDEIVIF